MENSYIFRTTSFQLVDAIVNHPDIRSTIQRGEERLCSRDVVVNDKNVVYAGPCGVVLFIYERPGVYLGHIAMMHGGRGKAALAAGHFALDDLFARFDASVVRAAVPLQLRGARMLCRMLGFHSVGRDLLQEFFVY